MLDTDESVDVACPKCGHKNPIPVSEAETQPTERIVCLSCKAEILVDTTEFQARMKEVRHEIEELQHAAKSKRRGPKGGDWQI